MSLSHGCCHLSGDAGLPESDPTRTRLAHMAANILGFAVGCAAAALAFVYLHMWCFAVPPMLAVVAIALRPQLQTPPPGARAPGASP